MYVTGRLLGLVGVGAIPTIVHPEYYVVFGWFLLCALIVLVDYLAAGRTSTLMIARSASDPIRLGDASSSTLFLTNMDNRSFRGEVRDAWQPSAGAVSMPHHISIPAGERRLVTTVLRPTRRGDRLAIRVTLRRRGPLGIAGRQKSQFVPGQVRALPPFNSRKHLPSRLARLRQLDGRSAVRIRGQGTEFDSLRDYVEGDDVRSIDWRATARRRSTVVRTWQPEKDRHIMIVLDTSRTSAGRVEDMPRLDSAMDAALLLAALAAHAGDRVDLIAGDRRIHRRVTSTKGLDLLSHLVNAMAPLEPALLEADWPLLGAEVARLSKQRALLVLLTPLEPAAIEESLLPTLAVLAQRYRVIIGSVADPALPAMLANRSDTESTFDAAAAARAIEQRERMASAVGRLGVDVIDAVPDKLPPALADHYLTLKSRGLL